MFSEDTNVQWMTSTDGDTALCPSCANSLVGYTPSADHHGAKCGHCGAALIVVSTSSRSTLVAIDRCPEELRLFLAWCQSTLDELEFVSLVVSLEEVLFGGVISTTRDEKTDQVS